MVILDGVKVAKEIKAEIKIEVEKILSLGKRAPHLAAILVGEDGASKAYVNSKIKDCAEVGYKSTLLRLPESTREEELVEKIKELNSQEGLDGFIVQLPLPKHINEEKILMAINPERDVDGFHPTNFGKMALDMETFIPATPFGIITLLDRYKIETSGKHCVVIGRSHIVGKPMSILMGRKANPGNCTVTLTHSRTHNLKNFTQQADIIITALGVPNFLKADMVKEGVTVIDVGITRVKDISDKRGYRLVGDVDYEKVAEKCAYITPVPGGVGPMTRAMLLQNSLLSYNRNH